MTDGDQFAPPRPLLLVISTGDRNYREYLLRSIGAHYRIHLIIGTDPTWERAYIDDCTVLDMSDTVNADAMIDVARKVAAGEPVHGVLSWDEARVLQTARVAAALGLPGGDADVVMRCRDKHQTREALAAAGVPQPRSVLASTVDEALAAAADIGYPVVLKPRAMGASLGVVRADTPDELVSRFVFARDLTVPGSWRYDTALVEEYLPDQEISVDSAVWHGEVMPICVARKEIGFAPYFEEIGHFVDGTDPLLTDPELIDVLRAAHLALGFTDGMTHTEIKLTAAGPKIIEVNARIGGGLIPYLGMRARGIDPGLAAAAVACGRCPDVTADRALVGAIRFRYVDRDDVTVDGIDIPETLPAGVHMIVPLVKPGDVVSPPPKGTLSGRIVALLALAASVGECRRALDEAASSLVIRTTDSVPAG